MAGRSFDQVRSAYEAWNRGDQERALRIFHPDIEWHLPEGGMNVGTYHGHQGMRLLMDRYFDAFDHLKFVPEQFFEAGDQIVVFVRLSIRGKGSGAAVEVPMAHLWTMREDKAARVEVITARDEALEAAGLPSDTPAQRP